MMRSIPGEIVEVQGGHIVRSMGGKDRHSKVCTAKGPRDRRVRLSAHTAIQFYDVQDRLGYDRPSKAVDWLINNAKAAIDELAELPAWHPTALSSNNPPPPPQQEAVQGESSKKPMLDTEAGSSSHNYSFIGGGGGINGNSGFLPPSLDSDAIADTIKSFFPIAAATSPSSSRQPLGYQNYLPHLLSRTSSQNQDLRLSLHSFQDPIYHQQQHQQQQNPTPTGHHAIFSGYDSTAISMPQWNVAEASGSGDSHGGRGGGGRFAFNVPPPQAQQALPLHPMLGQGQFFTQREPLQSSTPPFVSAWVDPMAAAENPMHPMFHPSVQSIGFVSGSSGFSSFRIPARIQGEEEHDGISDKPSSTSSGSHH